jgi:hypothetical protein
VIFVVVWILFDCYEKIDFCLISPVHFSFALDLDRFRSSLTEARPVTRVWFPPVGFSTLIDFGCHCCFWFLAAFLVSVQVSPSQVTVLLRSFSRSDFVRCCTAGLRFILHVLEFMPPNKIFSFQSPLSQRTLQPFLALAPWLTADLSRFEFLL